MSVPILTLQMLEVMKRFVNHPTDENVKELYNLRRGMAQSLSSIVKCDRNTKTIDIPCGRCPLFYIPTDDPYCPLDLITLLYFNPDIQTKHLLAVQILGALEEKEHEEPKDL